MKSMQTTACPFSERAALHDFASHVQSRAPRGDSWKILGTVLMTVFVVVACNEPSSDGAKSEAATPGSTISSAYLNDLRNDKLLADKFQALQKDKEQAATTDRLVLTNAKEIEVARLAAESSAKSMFENQQSNEKVAATQANGRVKEVIFGRGLEAVSSLGTASMNNKARSREGAAHRDAAEKHDTRQWDHELKMAALQGEFSLANKGGEDYENNFKKAWEDRSHYITAFDDGKTKISKLKPLIGELKKAKEEVEEIQKKIKGNSPSSGSRELVNRLDLARKNEAARQAAVDREANGNVFAEEFLKKELGQIKTRDYDTWYAAQQDERNELAEQQATLQPIARRYGISGGNGASPLAMANASRPSQVNIGSSGKGEGAGLGAAAPAPTTPTSAPPIVSEEPSPTKDIFCIDDPKDCGSGRDSISAEIEKFYTVAREINSVSSTQAKSDLLSSAQKKNSEIRTRLEVAEKSNADPLVKQRIQNLQALLSSVLTDATSGGGKIQSATTIKEFANQMEKRSVISVTGESLQSPGRGEDTGPDRMVADINPPNGDRTNAVDIFNPNNPPSPDDSNNYPIGPADSSGQVMGG